MINELDTVVLTQDIPDQRLKAGDLGTVVMSHNGSGYEVEFVALDGQTVAVVTLDHSQVRPIGTHEIAHSRHIDLPLAA